MRLAMLAVLLCLGGCQSSSTGLGEKEVPPVTVPAAVKAPCRDVVAIPDRDLSSAEVGRLWGQDRASLGECGRRHKTLADAVAILEAAP